MNKKLIVSSSLSILLMLPLLVSAVTIPATPNGGLTQFTDLLNPILNVLWQVFIGLGFIMLIIAGFLFLTSQGSAEKTAAARQALIWASIGIAVGIIAFSLPIVIRNLFPANA